MEMNRQDIMDNGMLERYLLGDLNDQEVLAVERILDQDKELKAYYEEMELSFEKMAMENSIEPPSGVKSELMQAVIHQVENGGNGSKVEKADKPSRRYNTKFLVAASLAGVLLLNSVWLYNKWQGSQQNMEELQVETEALKEQLNQIEEQLASSGDLLEKLNSPEVDKHILKGNSLSPESVAIAYVNNNERSVILNCKGLKPLSGNETYQMWADVDGEMIDMGVIPKDVEMVELAYIDKAESLNITIEPEGGNDHPTVERLITNVIL